MNAKLTRRDKRQICVYRRVFFRTYRTYRRGTRQTETERRNGLFGGALRRIPFQRELITISVYTRIGRTRVIYNL